MVFSSLVFLFAYLPLTLLIYYVTPRKWRNLFLFFINLVFYGWGEPLLVTLMLINIVINYIGGWLVDRYRSDEKKKKLFLIITCALDIGILAVFKYTGMVTETLNNLPFMNIPDLKISLPIGISFYTFQTMSYVIDVYRDDAPPSRSLINFGTYVALFPQLIAGPIVRYRDVAEQLIHRRETFAMFTKGVKLFCVGLAKKVLIANQMGVLTSAVLADEHNGILGVWVGLLGYAFQIYFDFSGYSDMACGLGNMLGFEFLKNFNYPYISTSITDFWRRWHISLSTWFKEYVYIPLGGNRKGVGRQIINLLIVWGLTGLWHGAAYNFILWGLYYGGMLILEKFVLKRFLDKLPAPLLHVYTMVLVLIGWGIFYFEDFGQMKHFFHAFFGGAEAFTDFAAVNALSSYGWLWVVAILFCLPVRDWLNRWVSNWKHPRPVLLVVTRSVLAFLLLALSVALLVGATNNAFLYTRF